MDRILPDLGECAACGAKPEGGGVILSRLNVGRGISLCPDCVDTWGDYYSLEMAHPCEHGDPKYL